MSSQYRSVFPHGLMFHRVHKTGTPHSGQGSITDEQFESILLHVGLERIISANEWLDKLADGKLRSSDICITFDDGLRGQYDVCLSILKKYSKKAFWFIYSSVMEGGEAKSEIYSYFITNYFFSVEEFYKFFFNKFEKNELKLQPDNSIAFDRYCADYKKQFPFYSGNDIKFRFLRNNILTKEKVEQVMEEIMKEKKASKAEIKNTLWFSNEEIKMLVGLGHVIGLHSHTHPLQLSELSYHNQLLEYSENQEYLKNLCSKDIISMAHPLNSYNKETLQILSELGIMCGFRSNMQPPNGQKINPTNLELAREDPKNILDSLKCTSG